MKTSPAMSREARELLCLALAFVVGFFVSLAVWVWIFLRYGWKEMAWWEVLPTALQILLASATGGVALCGAVLWLSMKWRMLTGTHQCVVCERRQHSPGLCAHCRAELPEG